MRSFSRSVLAFGATAALGLVLAGAGAEAGGHVIRVGSLRVDIPAGWTWAKERGGYRNCANPAIKLWVASYRLPNDFGRHEGPLVVAPGQVLIVFVALPARSDSTIWKRWRVSNANLRPAVAADGSRYKAQLSFPATPAARATLWAGNARLSRGLLRTTNRLLTSLSVDRRYGCR